MADISMAITIALSISLLFTATTGQEHMNSENLTLRVDQVSSQHTGFVGFTAYKTSTQAVTAGDTVTFDGVLLNEGGFYQPALSRFTCLVDGVYFVSLNVQMSDGYTFLQVVKEQQVALYVYGRPDNTNNIISNAGIIGCLSGEFMSVIVDYSSSASIYGETGVPKTTFSVMLMSNSEGSEVQKHQNFVGFSVRKSDEQLLEPGDTVIFDDVAFNPDNDYISSLNHFVCPQSGIYYTYFTIWKDYQDTIYVGLEKNSIMELHAEDYYTVNEYNTMSNSYISQCEFGERMSIIAIQGGSIHGEPDRHVTSFSAMLMLGTDQFNRSIATKQHTSFAGFSAFKRFDQSYVVGETISFDGVMINEGGHYSSVLSQFTCPGNGIYFVAVTLVKLGNNNLSIELRRDTLAFLKVEETLSSFPYNTVSNNVLVRCFQGQAISVKASGTGGVHGDANKALTTFTIMQMSSD